VVWEGWRRETSPYPDQWPMASFRGGAAIQSLSVQSGHSQTCYWLDPVANDPKLKPSIPHRSALRCSLFLSRSTPCAWSYTNNAGEVTREMRVVAEAALHGHIGERQPVIAQLFLGQHDALLN
jgi:hypothetical protein